MLELLKFVILQKNDTTILQTKICFQTCLCRDSWRECAHAFGHSNFEGRSAQWSRKCDHGLFRGAARWDSGWQDGRAQYYFHTVSMQQTRIGTVMAKQIRLCCTDTSHCSLSRSDIKSNEGIYRVAGHTNARKFGPVCSRRSNLVRGVVGNKTWGK